MILDDPATPSDPSQIIADLRRERDEALAREAAIAEVLQVINSSPGDLASVFRTMLEKALRLCEATHGTLRTFDGEAFHLAAAAHGEALAFPGLRPGGPSSLFRRFIDGEQIVHLTDVLERPEYQFNPTARQGMDAARLRTWLGVSLRKGEKLLGVISAARQEVRPFTDKQITLLQNFSAQAVIAMENARLLIETREALEQQTATAEVLQVINSSPGDLTPVFDAMLERAHSLCGAARGALALFDGESFRAVAIHGYPDEVAEEMRRPYGANAFFQRIVDGDRYVQISDFQAVSAQLGDPVARAAAGHLDIRTWLAVPLRKEGLLLGYISAVRSEVRPFSNKEIELLENFAMQAVIAMENARLLTETREALEQQTATAEVLQIINSSPGDLAPVFDAILEKAHTLCGAAAGALLVFEGEQYRVAAVHGAVGLSAIWAPGTCLPMLPRDEDSPLPRLMRGEPLIHLPDATDDPMYRAYERYRRLIDAAGSRTLLVVPLRKQGAVLGAITAFHQEVRPFSDKQITLLQNFAAQAVIAMENARLLTETREALEQQTATAEVLQVINSSPGVLGPVFDVVLERALRLCEATFGFMAALDGELVRVVAEHGIPAKLSESHREPYPVVPGTPMHRFLHGAEVIHIVDAINDPDTWSGASPRRRPYVELGGARSILAVPLRKDASLLGCFVIYRQYTQAFSDKQITLLQNFAAQAVIAMENARLINETREALEQQTATSEVLQVINSSPGNLAPVFDKLTETAARLCETDMAALAVRDGDAYRYVASRSLDPAWQTYLNDLSFTPGRGTITGRTLLERKVIHIADLAADQEHTVPAAVTIGGLRTFLCVPLLREGEPIGVVSLVRRHVEPFTDRQISLINTFADQAVIAMENARLITETREALEQQTATAEVLQVINASPGNLQPVFDAMLEKATRLCEAASGHLYACEGDAVRLLAAYGDLRLAEHIRHRGLFRPVPGVSQERVLRGEQVVHIVDVLEDQAYRAMPTFEQMSALNAVRTLVSLLCAKMRLCSGS
jgi:GAF domain-containing protein